MVPGRVHQSSDHIHYRISYVLSSQQSSQVSRVYRFACPELYDRHISCSCCTDEVNVCIYANSPGP